jgi:hypothetical protein
VTTKEFLENYNGAPIDFSELAELCLRELDDGPLKKFAKEYIKTLNRFEDCLYDIGYEFG